MPINDLDQKNFGESRNLQAFLYNPIILAVVFIQTVSKKRTVNVENSYSEVFCKNEKSFWKMKVELFVNKLEVLQSSMSLKKNFLLCFYLKIWEILYLIA